MSLAILIILSFCSIGYITSLLLIFDYLNGLKHYLMNCRIYIEYLLNTTCLGKSQAWWFILVILATWEAEAAEW
jgi:succinate dehydrogenase/fumarate reductase cytochrome b subunit